MAKKQILFVDDQEMILSLLRCIMANMKDEWDMHFAGGGEEALALIRSQHFDVVVTDYDMPAVDGGMLMEELERDYPNTVRMVFSGVPKETRELKLFKMTHRFLDKSDDLKEIKRAIMSALAVRSNISDSDLARLVARVKTLPTPSDLYMRLMKELRSRDCTVQSIGAIIEQDLAMSAKILQVVNSAFFGVSKRVQSPAHAASLLGVETIRSLVFMLNVFSEMDASMAKSFSAIDLWQHSVDVGIYARQIAEAEQLGDEVVDQCFMSGFFHDLGKLILAANLPQECDAVANCPRKSEKNWLINEERKIIHSTHSEVGAYLLGLWNFPLEVIHTAAYHHEPAKCPVKTLCPLTIVHVANVLANVLTGSLTGTQIDHNYLAAVGKEDKLAEWRQVVTTSTPKKG